MSVNLYFEFDEAHTRRYDGHKVWVRYETKWDYSTAIMNQVFRHSSDRVWEETESEIYIVDSTNRYGDATKTKATDEQLKEFFLIKLQAKNIDTEAQ